MHKPALALLTLGMTALGACASPAVRIPTTPVVPVPPIDTGGTTPLRELSFAAGRYHYRFIQATEIQAESENPSIPGSGRISTVALLVAEITQDSGSTYRVTVAVDSLQLIREGQVTGVPIIPLTLGVILEAFVANGRIATATRLPDSLCAYSQFVTLARQLILPQMPNDMATPNSAADTMTLSTCRAGTRIGVVAIQELSQDRSQPYQINLHERIDLAGVGMLGKDSVAISGSMRTDGTAEFDQKLRLPSAVKTNSQGSITVRLGNSVATFRQESRQTTIRESFTPR